MLVFDHFQTDVQKMRTKIQAHILNLHYNLSMKSGKSRKEKEDEVNEALDGVVVGFGHSGYACGAARDWHDRGRERS